MIRLHRFRSLFSPNVDPVCRDDTHRDAEVRTTFPSISRKVGSANGGRRRSSSIRSDRRGRSFASGEQGFHSSDDDDDENVSSVSGVSS